MPTRRPYSWKNEDLEEQVMDYLVSVTDLKVFGCCIDFLQTATDLPRGPNLGKATSRNGIHHRFSKL